MTKDGVTLASAQDDPKARAAPPLRVWERRAGKRNAPGARLDAQLTSRVTRDMLAALRPGELASGTGSSESVS